MLCGASGKGKSALRETDLKWEMWETVPLPCLIGERGKGLSSRPPSLQPPPFLRKISQLNPASWETLGIVFQPPHC